MKILVTGGDGLVGTALQEILKETKYIVFAPSSRECNLVDYEKTLSYFQSKKPDFIIHLAAMVGGLYKNMNEKVDMFEKNMKINMNVLECAYRCNIKKVVSCLSTCIFPDKTTYPINEEMLHNGPPHFSNDAYAYAKRMLEIHSTIYNKQYGTNFTCVIPTNIYGPNDNFSLEDGHVIPSLIHKCYLAKKERKEFIVRGTGKPFRQFIFSKDLAKLILWVLEKYTEKTPIILSVSEKEEVSIREIAYKIAENFHYEEYLVFDSSYADGQFKKTADNSKLLSHLKNFQFTSVDNGIQETIEWFIKNYETIRK
jgi:GDP-L-fucose synthase